MPRGDRTGPSGFGPMTGRGAGYCTGNTVPGYANPYGRGRGGGGGRGWSRGMGRNWGRGWAHGWGYAPYAYAPPATPWGPVFNAPWGQAPTREQEAEFLKDQQESLKQQVEEIEKRLQELAAEEKK